MQSQVSWPNGSVLPFLLPCLCITRKKKIHWVTKHFLLLNLQFNLPILSLLLWEGLFIVKRDNCFLFRYFIFYCPVPIFVGCHFVLFTHSIILTGTSGKNAFKGSLPIVLILRVWFHITELSQSLTWIPFELNWAERCAPKAHLIGSDH